jgi:hypothetical protein
MIIIIIILISFEDNKPCNSDLPPFMITTKTSSSKKTIDLFLIVIIFEEVGVDNYILDKSVFSLLWKKPKPTLLLYDSTPHVLQYNYHYYDN